MALFIYLFIFFSGECLRLYHSTYYLYQRALSVSCNFVLTQFHDIKKRLFSPDIDDTFYFMFVIVRWTRFLFLPWRHVDDFCLFIWMEVVAQFFLWSLWSSTYCPAVLCFPAFFFFFFPFWGRMTIEIHRKRQNKSYLSEISSLIETRQH